MLNLKTHAALAAALLFAGAAGAATTNGFANGGFESAGAPLTAGWLTAATSSPAALSNDAHAGSHALLLSAKPFDASIALQDSRGHGGLPALDAANVGDTPVLSFWAKGDASANGNAFVTVRYMGENGGILGNAVNDSFTGLINPGAWSLISFQAAAVPVGTTALFIEIGASLGAPTDGRLSAILVDDLKFTLTTAPVPEPSSYALLAGGLAVLGMAARRRRT